MESFRNWKIRTKLISAFSVVAVIAGFVGYVGVSNMRSIDTAYSDLYVQSSTSLSALIQVAKDVQRLRVNLRDVMLADSSTGTRQYLDRIAQIKKDLDAQTGLYEGALASDSGRVLYGRFKEQLEGFEGMVDQMLALAEAGDRQAAMHLMRGDAFRAAMDLDAAANVMIDQAVRAGLEASDAATAQTNRSVQIMVIVLLLGVLTALGLGLFLARLISRPVIRLEQAAQRVAGGDNSVNVDVDTKEELGSLAGSFNRMVASIREGIDALAEEKAGVERKVEEAVRESEQARRYLSASVDRMIDQMNRFASGDLTVFLQVEQQDEIGRLFEAFNQSVGNLREMLRQVNEAVSAAATASTEISASTEQLATSSQEQSSQAGEVAAAVEQMVRTIIENSRNATETADVARQNGTAARDGDQVVQRTIAKVQSIATVVGESRTTVERLGASATQIGEIVQTIDEIADQTNLLALNAAIEAARAGEQGRGFAVVADEVRKLAERSAAATKQIAGMIRAIQAETGEAVGAMRRGDEEVREGLALTDETSASFGRIVEGVDRSVDMATRIAAASEEQSTTSEQIARSIEMISTATHESAQGVSQIARATDDLNRITEQLASLVARFTLDAGARPAVRYSTGGDGAGRVPTLRHA